MAFLDENGLAHLWQGLKGKFLALTGGNSFGNVKATGAIGAGYRLYTGDSEGTTSGTPGAVPKKNSPERLHGTARPKCWP